MCAQRFPFRTPSKAAKRGRKEKGEERTPRKHCIRSPYSVQLQAQKKGEEKNQHKTPRSLSLLQYYVTKYGKKKESLRRYRRALPSASSRDRGEGGGGGGGG